MEENAERRGHTREYIAQYLFIVNIPEDRHMLTKTSTYLVSIETTLLNMIIGQPLYTIIWQETDLIVST